MITALLIAVAAALGALAGFTLCHHRYSAQLAKLDGYEQASRRDVEYRKAIPAGWYQRQIQRMNASAIKAAAS